MNDKVPTFLGYLTPGRENPTGRGSLPRLEVSRETRSTPQRTGQLHRDRVQSGWVGKNQLTAVLDQA